MMQPLLTSLRTSFCLLVLVILLVGGVYPLTVTVVAQLVFHHRANGSLIVKNDKVAGSELLGQEFTGPQYFWSRLSATTPPYNAAASGGSNLGAANPKLMNAVENRLAALRKAERLDRGPVPVGLVTASASGLDPHLALDAVEYQVPRVARARKLKEEDVRAMVAQHTTGGGRFSLSGRPYVNVLMLNMALDGAIGAR